ncbi:histidine kinase [Streptomyces sp. NPDC001508]|uniref:sensor histidine kinase n=1 Tax=Streptomyces sp. NPDC001508 TaxID=3154656 RepID=UPI003333FA57
MTDSHDRSDSADESRGSRPGAVAPPGCVPHLPAPRIARTVLITALLGHALLTATSVLASGGSPAAEATGLVLLPALLALQLLHCAPSGNRAPLKRRCLTLALQALLAYLPFMVFQVLWATMAGYLAASLLLLLPHRAAWPLYAAVGLSVLVPALLQGRGLLHSVHLTQTTLLTGLVLYGLAHLTGLITHLHTTRGELARQAVTGERLRFARDLHDLLGFSLSAITLKTELVHQLIETQPARAMKEIDEVLAIAGQSLTDVRKAASGYRALSLQQEIRAAQSMLHAAGVQVRAEGEPGALSPHLDTALAATLREAVTNLLRHSNAAHCRISVARQDGAVRLLVENDGVDPAYHNPAPHSGNGLGNLRTRMTAIGGRLESGIGKDGTFRLVAEAPVRKPSENSAEPRDFMVPRNGSAA